MPDLQILKQLEKKLNIKFNKVSNARRLFFDLAPQEAAYALNADNQIVGLKIKGYELTEIPQEISDFKSANIINFSHNKIKDISALSPIKSLTAVNLSQNNISDISAIGNLIKIKWLNLKSNEISDILTLSKNLIITKLYLDNNNISDLSPLSNLTYLRELTLSGNKISNIEHISKLVALKEIELANNKITDISVFRKLNRLEAVNLSKNKIAEVPDLSNLSPKVAFNISHNKIKSKQQFDNLKCVVYATGNPLLDVYVFTEPQDGVLNVDWLADISANIITQLVTEKGSMLGIFGKWGRGKTFFWNVLKKRLINKNFDIVEFLAWKYHDTPASWAYLFEAFARKFYNRPQKRFTFDWFKYVFKILYTSIVREPTIAILRFVVGIILPVILFFALSSQLDTLQQNWDFFGKLSYFGLWGTYAVVVYYYFTKVYSLNMPNIFKRMSSKNFENMLGMQSEIEKELIFLMERWNKKVVLFVDDLDRCSEERILEVIDSLRIMTENEKIAKNLTIVAAIDERILKRVIRNKYSKMVDDEAMLDVLTREYLDKLFLFGIKLAALNEQERVEIFDNYTSKIENLMSGSPTKVFIKKPYDVNQIVVPNDFNFIREYLKKVKEITPRQIRIVYNKFLLSKEILKANLQVEELNETQKEIITAMIMYFSFDEKVEKIDNFINSYEKEETEISRTIFDKEFKTSTKNWKSYIDVIKQTVPY